MSALVNPSYTGTFALGKRTLYGAIFNGERHGTKRPIGLMCSYVIRCEPTGHVYLGATQSFYARWRSHAWMLANGKHKNQQLQVLYDKHGVVAFTISIVQHLDSADDLEHCEERAASAFDSNDLLNFRIGNTVKEGWSAKQHAGLRMYKPKVKRGPNSVSRWFDYTGARHA